MTDNAERPRPPPNRRRDKAQLSCNSCRHLKRRCDRQQPCGACSRRGITDSCSYATGTSSTSDTRPPLSPRQSASLHGRISELESLVVGFMKGQSLPTPPAANSARTSSISPPDVLSETHRPKEALDEPASPADPGTLHLHESGTSYVQSVHWEAILAKIRGLKEDLVADSKAPLGSHLFYGPHGHATRDEILAAVPPRSACDRLMAIHFDSYIVTPYLIHGKKFLREYEAFWEDPSSTSIAWIGLMFSMLYIAAQLQTFSIDLNDARGELLNECFIMKDAFLEKSVQCLILARYTMGGPHILETLIMILTGQFVVMKDSATDGWLLISMIFHIAMRMGYHRDPDHFPGISPFESEMRRRIWTTILQIDISLSLEMGLPRNAEEGKMDTKPPLNFRDDDFDEHTTEMPPPRPETEWTPVLPLIARGRLVLALGLICDVNTATHPPSYEEIIKIDTLLEDVHSRAVPPLLRSGSMQHPITDSPNLVVQRVSVETTYHKSRILLYRRALINKDPARQSQQRDREAVRICLASALKILAFQEMLYEESQPGGRLSQLRWKVTHIFNQDVLLATSVLCLYLQEVDKFDSSERAGQKTYLPSAEDIRQQLVISHKIWLQMSAASAEAGKVAKALSIVLGYTEASGGDGGGLPSYEGLFDFDAMPWNEFGAVGNNQYFPASFYSPIAFFDNVLETRGT